MAALLTIVLFALAGCALWCCVDGYRITSAIDPVGPSNPLLKTVEAHDAGAWFANYGSPSVAAGRAGRWALSARWLRLLGLRLRREMFDAAVQRAGDRRHHLDAWASRCSRSSCRPRIDPRASLTVWDSSSSHLTLFIMLVVTVIFLPIILAYTSWVYHVLWGKVDEQAIRDESGHAY